MGYDTEAKGHHSLALGAYTVASADYSTIIGKGRSFPVIKLANQIENSFMIGYMNSDTDTIPEFFVKESRVGVNTDNPQYSLDVVGTINASEAVLVNGTPADYVFEDDYDLETIEDHAEFMWREKHLPALEGKETLKGKINIAKRLEQAVEELEKAHVYIEQLNKRIEYLEEKDKERQ